MIPAPNAIALRQILASLAVVASCAWSAIPDRAKTVVVLDLAGPGIPRADATVVSARLGRSLAATGRFRLVERDSEIAGRSPSFSTVCQDLDCALRVGRISKVDRVLMGELAIDGPAWVLTTRMVDVATSSPLLRTSWRTENGFRDLVDRGTVGLASRYDSVESRLDAVFAKRKPEEIREIRDTAQEAMLQREVHGLRAVAGTACVLGVGALVVGMDLYLINLLRGALNEREPDMTATYAWIGSGVVLETAAFVSASVALERARQLEALRNRSLLDLSWTPVWVPLTGAVGLATRVAF